MLFDPEQYLYLESKGKRFAYMRSGVGEPVLMVHGITTYSFIWRKLIGYLDNDFDLIRLDLLGCGASEMSVSFDLSLKNHAEEIIGFLDVLGLEKVHLIGHDLGGGISQILAVRYPSRIKSVILMNTVGYNYWPVQPIVAMRTPIIRQLAMAAFDVGYHRTIVKKALYNDSAFTRELLDLFLVNFRDSLARKSFLHFARCLDNNNLMEIAEQLKQVTMPVLILRAEKDVYLSSEISDKLNSDIPGSIFKVIPGSGHYMQEDAPAEISEEIRMFINSVHG